MTSFTCIHTNGVYQQYKGNICNRAFKCGSELPEYVALILRNGGSQSPDRWLRELRNNQKRVGRKNYYALLGSENQEDNNVLIENEIENEMLAEEKMYKAYIQYSKELENNILERILHCKPEFFERLVVDLLIKMGYGYDNKSGKVVGKSHDGGVDGIIQEDKLGLSNIYIQAKRYSGGNKVGSHEIQAFVGAMQKVQKGVFITTSDFTKEALKFSEDQQQKQLRLVSGHELARLIIQNEVGLEPIQKYAVYKIDDEYFDDEI